ncbi:MAG: DNA repair exonuclease [Pseudomonadota bacterium]
MTFRFLHTADWHIGKSFGGFSAEKRALLSDARMSMIERIANLAGRLDIEHVLVAGDVFDSPKLPDSILRQTMHRLGQFKNVHWHLLPGNHDPAGDRGIWDRVETLGRPSNVFVSSEPDVIALRPDVALLTAPIANARSMEDPTAHFGSMPVREGVIRIGLAHGSVQQFGRGNDEEASILIAADRAERDGLDYLALGDWHGQKKISDRTSYSGTPEPESFVDNEPGFVLSVAIERSGAAPLVEQHQIGLFSWSRLDYSFSSVAGPSSLLDALHDVRDNGLRTLSRVKLSGPLSLTDAVELRSRLDELADIAFHLDINWDNVELAVGSAEVELFADDRLSALAEKLGRDDQDLTDADARVRRRALQLLAGFAASSRVGPVHAD